MLFSLAQLALASCATAAPIALEARGAINDLAILNFALTLEHLEDAFYHEGLKKFSQGEFKKAGYLPRTRVNVQEVSVDESSHVKFLTAAIKAAGGTPVQACTYDFNLTDATSFMNLASVLEGVGVAAYLGAAALIMDKQYLTAAGSILTVEARHNAYIRDNHQPGPRSPFPQSFDAPLSANEVYTLATSFIKSCPKGPVLPFKAFPSMTTMNTKVLRPKDVATFAVAKNVKLPKTLYAAFATATGPVFTPVTVVKGKNHVKITIPAMVAGQSYVVLTNAKNVTDSTIVAGPGLIEIQAPYTYGGFPM